MKNSRSGFTLIEVLVAATIIGILSSAGYMGMGAITRNARDSKRKTDLELVRSSLEMYKSTNQQYPDYAPNVTCMPALPADYVNTYPTDPKTGTYRYCYQFVNALNYRLCAHLENSSGADTNCGGANNCGTATTSETCNYQITNP